MPDETESVPSETEAAPSETEAAPSETEAAPSEAEATPESAGPGRSRAVRGVIFDWGGVVTGPLLDTIDAWIRAEQIDRDSYTSVMRSWVSAAYGDGADNPVHALERGECTNEEFEAALAAQLTHEDGRPVVPDGLLARMFAAGTVENAMVDLIRALRQAGLRTALLSNSWGSDDYPRHLFPELFDVVVISAEVGMRKPEERIFRHTAALLGLDPEECVFIDDVAANIAAAEAIGLIGVHHREPAPTTARLTELLGVPLG